MTNPPTGPSIPTGGGWEQIRRERRRVAVISISIVAAAILVAVLIVALGTGGDDSDPSSSPSASNSPGATGTGSTADPTAEPTGAGQSGDGDDGSNAKSSPEETVDDYIQALRDADVDAAIAITCGGLYQEAVNAKDQGLGVSKDFSQLKAPVTKTEDPPFETPAPAQLVWVDWEDGSDTVDRIFLTMVVNDEWKACEVGNEDQPPSPTSTDAATGY